jgi:hypothetical protein
LGDISGASSATWAVSGRTGNAANAADFTGGVLPTGTVNFAAGDASEVVTINVAGDTTAEKNEGFTVTLSSPTNATITTAAATGNINNDDGKLKGRSPQTIIDATNSFASDIGVVDMTLASYSDTNSSGMLTVSDGTDSTNIALLRQYLASQSQLMSGGGVVTNPAIDPAAEQQSFLSQPGWRTW